MDKRMHQHLLEGWGGCEVGASDVVGWVGRLLFPKRPSRTERRRPSMTRRLSNGDACTKIDSTERVLHERPYINKYHT